jgi:hypothetical protein
MRPTDPQADCPVCGAGYDSVSVHDSGLVVNLLDNERYRRVCFEPVERDGAPHVRFYHHTHDQVSAHSGSPTEGDPVGDEP